MNNEFKINIFYMQDGEEIENIIANYLMKTLKKEV